jgi:hypothetical protein
MIGSLTAMVCLATAVPVLAAQSVLHAVSSPGLDLAEAWADREGWASARPAVLRGVDGAGTPAAEVRVRWNESAVFFEFLCRDVSVVSPGQQDGLDHFKLGDVVEIFLGRRGDPSYIEVHATPAGRKTVYAFRDYREPTAPRAGCEVRAGQVEDGWRAVLAIPWRALGGQPDEGSWEFLAGRYDYDAPGGRAVLSSFPAQTGKPDFHKRGRFAKLLLLP